MAIRPCFLATMQRNRKISLAYFNTVFFFAKMKLLFICFVTYGERSFDIYTTSHVTMRAN